MESPTQDQTSRVSTGQKRQTDSSSDDQSSGKTQKTDVDVNHTASNLTTGENIIDVDSRRETKITNCQDVTVIDSVNAPGGVVNIHGNTSNQGSTNIEVTGLTGGSAETVTQIGLQKMDRLDVQNQTVAVQHVHGSTNIEVTGLTGGSAETVSQIGLQKMDHLDVQNQTVAVQHVHGDRSSLLDNIVEDTWHCIKGADPKKHVSTYAERSARQLLKQSGAIFIKGISGSGKSRLALNLLAAIAKEEQRLPILLSSCKQWDYIQKKTNEKQKISPCASGSDQEVHSTVKYVVMIDDIFGSSNLVQSHVDEWVKLFDIMVPYLESGEIKLVITSRPEISRQCERQIMKCRLMKKMTSFALHEGRYALKKHEKIKMVERICGNVQKFTKDQLDIIACMNVSLGFPQCCHFFAGSSEAQKKGTYFFYNPKAFVLEEVERLEDCDGTGHLVLLIVLMKNGCLAKNLLSLEAYSNELKPLVAKVQECCHISSPLTQADIRKKADSLCGVYLICTEKGYEFQHQSIYDCVFTNVSQNYPDLTIGFCPVQMLLELVRTKKDDTEGVTVCLEVENYDLLADRMTKLLLSENYKYILDHPSLHHDQFVVFLLKKWKSENKLQDIIKYKHEPKSVYVKLLKFREFDVFGLRRGSMMESVRETICSVFQYTYLSEDIILRKLGLLTKCLIKDSKINDKSLLSCLLVCAVYIEDNILVQNLLKMGAETSMGCYRTMFHAKGIAKTVTNKILLKCNLDEMPDLENPFIMAVQRGNINVVKLIVTMMKGSRNIGNMCRNNLKFLLTGMTEKVYRWKKHLKLCFDPTTLSELIQLLYSSSEPKDDVKVLIWMSASHLNSTALKEFLTLPGINLYERIHYARCYLGSTEYHRYTTIFEEAVLHGGTACVDELISYHARNEGSVEELVNQKIEDSNPASSFTYPLHMAAAYGKADNMKLLIQNGANVNIKNSNDETALCVSTSNRYVECVKVLLQANALATEKGKFDTTPFARLYDISFARDSMEIFDRSGESLVSIVRYLVTSGCDINERDPRDRSCISKAVFSQDKETVSFLCEKGASVDEWDDQGNTLLQIASKQCDKDMVELLYTMGAKTDTVNNDGKSVIHMAAASDTDAIEKLLYFLHDKGVNGATLDNQGRTALFDAVKSGDKEVMELLEERGLDMKQRDNTGKTLLHVACESTRSLDVIKMIIDAGVKPENVEEEGNTALHYFSKFSTNIWLNDVSDLDMKEVTELLAENKVILNARNISGETPLHLAFICAPAVMVAILIQMGADPCVKDNLGNTPLHLAVRYGHIDRSLIDLLIQNGADPNLKNQDGRTPLHCAADKGHLRIVEDLLRYGADPCVTDNSGNSSISLAKSRGRPAIEQILKKKAGQDSAGNG